ncbi:MAG: hypothetical protein JNK09_22585 [Prolixibacteraceae bacterium]|nr:hypothetical protein [Prolixibacteraceae bacterium]
MNSESNIYGLAYNCPAQNREADCPLKELDHLSFKEKVSFINNLNKEDREAILEHHKV